MFDNIDNMARIEREIGKRMEAAKCSRWMNCQQRNELMQSQTNRNNTIWL